MLRDFCLTIYAIGDALLMITDEVSKALCH